MYKDNRQERANRISWMIHNKRDLPRDARHYVVRHLCHNPPCVNAWHLSLGTQQQNIYEALIYGRWSTARRRAAWERQKH